MAAGAPAPTGLTLDLASASAEEDALVSIELADALTPPPWTMGPTEEEAVVSEPQKFLTITKEKVDSGVK